VSLSQAGLSLSAEEAGVLGLLLPHLAAVRVERAEISEDLVVIRVRARAEGAACPGCGTWSARVHDRYTRRLADAGIGGRRVLALLGVRRLKCGNGGCGKGTFAEQPAGLASWRARKTPPLAAALATAAQLAGGRPAARLAGQLLAVEVSRHTLVRILMALPEPAARLVRVLGVDDFCLRRGERYATILVDMESGGPVDVLPDREQDTLEKWLAARPGTEVICRDRAGAYAAAARAAAPDAAEVADRWHLWHNLCEHARDAVARHQDCIKGQCRHQDGQPPDVQDGQPGDVQDGQPGDVQDGQPGDGPADLAAAIRDRHAAVTQLRAAGSALPAAAAALGLTEQVTGRFWRAPDADALLASARPAPGLDPWKDHLRERWAQGATNIRALHAEITALGYAGSYSTTYGYASLFRLAAPPRPPAPPAPRQVTGWLTADPARLAAGDQASLAAILRRCPELDALAGHVAAFAKILTGRDGGRLDDWLAAAASPAQPELQSFANGIRRDYQAVRNGLTLEWSSGRVEGHNTRVKLLKRQMYGRASFPLLRKRILLTSRNARP